MSIFSQNEFFSILLCDLGKTKFSFRKVLLNNGFLLVLLLRKFLRSIFLYINIIFLMIRSFIFFFVLIYKNKKHNLIDYKIYINT